MNEKYVKDIENQNYDLIKKLAETQEILEDYESISRHNTDILSSLIIDMITELYYKTRCLHQYRVLLEESDIPHEYDDISGDLIEQSGRIAESYMSEMLDAITSNSKFSNSKLHETRSCDLFNKFVKPYIKGEEA